MSIKYFTEGGTTEGGIPFNVHDQTVEFKDKIKRFDKKARKAAIETAAQNAEAESAAPPQTRKPLRRHNSVSD